jgi:hypothetical protein
MSTAKTNKNPNPPLAAAIGSQPRTTDDIRNGAWYKVFSKLTGTTQLTHAQAYIEAMQRACITAADWIEACPFENALDHAARLRSFANAPDQ